MTPKALSRRELLRGGATVAGGVLVARVVPAWVAGATARQAATAADPIDAMRAQMGANPIEATKLTESLTMLSGPGGNVVVLNGRDGKIVVDSFVQTAWDKLKARLDAIGPTPVKSLIDTHWHFDHTDNNANFQRAGAGVIAHQNTAKRLSESHDLMGMHFKPAPRQAQPTQTFQAGLTLIANGEQIRLDHVAPAHTDTDIFVRFTKANVVHLGDVFFNGMYPFIDAGTGGHINGMIAAAGSAVKSIDSRTKVVPGHGPLGDKEALGRYHDMLVAVRDRVRKLKSGGQTLEQVAAANPTADYDALWGKGFMTPKDFVTIVYNTLRP